MNTEALPGAGSSSMVMMGEDREEEMEEAREEASMSVQLLLKFTYVNIEFGIY